MRVHRLYEKFASLCAVVALYLCAAAPAHAALVFVGETTLQPGTSSFDLTLASDALDDVGFDYFKVSLSYLPAVQSGETGLYVSGLGVVGLESLPDTVPGWQVSPLVNEELVVSYIGLDLAGRLPLGPLLKFSFQVTDPSHPFSQQITATLTRFDLDDQIQGDPLTRGTTVRMVPEPSSWLLLAAGLGALGFFARRRRA